MCSGSKSPSMTRAENLEVLPSPSVYGARKNLTTIRDSKGITQGASGAPRASGAKLGSGPDRAGPSDRPGVQTILAAFISVQWGRTTRG